jgi:hypothetical protein
MANRTKKPFKMKVLGLFTLEGENWNFRDVALILGMIMVFILLVIILLKVYAFPTLTGPPILDNIGAAVRKILSSRSP